MPNNYNNLIIKKVPTLKFIQTIKITKYWYQFQISIINNLLNETAVFNLILINQILSILLCILFLELT
jgi:hypothetical protein